MNRHHSIEIEIINLYELQESIKQSIREIEGEARALEFEIGQPTNKTEFERRAMKEELLDFFYEELESNKREINRLEALLNNYLEF